MAVYFSVCGSHGTFYVDFNVRSACECYAYSIGENLKKTTTFWNLKLIARDTGHSGSSSWHYVESLRHTYDFLNQKFDSFIPFLWLEGQTDWTFLV